MDKRLLNATELMGDSEISGFEEGFKFAIKRIRENKYYGHYAQFMANWLEKHLTEQVPEPTILSLKGDK